MRKKILITTIALCCVLFALTVVTAMAAGDDFSATTDTAPLDEAGYDYTDRESWLRVYVPFNGAITLKVQTTAHDQDGITYEWTEYGYDEDGDWFSYELSENIETLVIPHVSAYREYECHVLDNQGNEDTVLFCVYVDNHLTVSVDTDLLEETTSEYNIRRQDAYVYVPRDKSVKLGVNVEADDTIGLTYEWIEYAYDEEEDYWYSIKTFSETGDTLYIAEVNYNGFFACEVSDRFNNSTTIWFNVYVDNNLDVEPVGDSSVMVEYGAAATLAVKVTADDLDGITYEWTEYRYDEDGDWCEYELSENGDTLLISQVTDYKGFKCLVCDRYGNKESVWFYVYVDNNLSAEADGIDRIKVSYGDPVTMKVNVTADDLDGITYEWIQYIYDEDGDWVSNMIPDATSDTLKIAYITVSSRFACGISDKYGNKYDVWFDVSIDNNLNVSIDPAPIEDAGYKYEYDYIYVPLNKSVTLKVLVTADDLDGITYEWIEEEYDKEDDSWHVNDLSETSDTIVTTPVTGYREYRCRVRDKYGNTESVWFYVYVDNGFSAVADTSVFEDAGYKYNSDGTWCQVYVPYNRPLTLKVNADANDQTGLTYVWSDDSGATIDNSTNSLTIDKVVTRGYYYHCRVADRYGNEARITFDVYVDNDLNAKAVGDTSVSVDYGATATLQVAVTAKDMTGLTYEWHRLANAVDGETQPVDFDNNSDTFISEPIANYSEYWCDVRDRYGNISFVWFNVSVANHLSAKAVGDTTIAVPYGDTITLALEVTADDMSGLTYSWYRGDYYTYNGIDYYISELVDLENDSAILVTDPVITHSMYGCTVRDRYNNKDYITFDVSVDNGLSATVFGTDSDYAEIEVPVKGSASLKVDAKAKDAGDLKYKWLSFIPGTDFNGDPIIAATGTDLMLVDGSGDTKELTNVTKSKWYFSRVIDKFSNIVDVFFHVKVVNDLSVTPEQEDVSLPSGSSYTLTVTANALDTEGISYTWEKTVYDSHLDTDVWTDVYGSNASLQLKNVTESALYRCTITDKYDNIVYALFNVSVIDPNGYTVTLDDRTKGAAAINGIVNGGKYSGETTFTIACEDACAVLCTTDGENYTRLTGTEGGNGYSFNIDVTQDVTVLVALKGDVNLDGVLKNQDVTMAKAANLGKRTLSKLQEMVADVTGDGVFKNQDITKYKAALLGKTTLSWDI